MTNQITKRYEIHIFASKNQRFYGVCIKQKTKSAKHSSVTLIKTNLFLINMIGQLYFLTMSSCPPFISSSMINFEPYLQILVNRITSLLRPFGTFKIIRTKPILTVHILVHIFCTRQSFYNHQTFINTCIQGVQMYFHSLL